MTWSYVRISMIIYRFANFCFFQTVMRKTNYFTRKTKILLYFNELFVKSIVLRVKTSVLRVKHWINDPFDHKLQITLINVTTFYA